MAGTKTSILPSWTTMTKTGARATKGTEVPWSLKIIPSEVPHEDIQTSMNMLKQVQPIIIDDFQDRKPAQNKSNSKNIKIPHHVASKDALNYPAKANVKYNPDIIDLTGDDDKTNVKVDKSQMAKKVKITLVSNQISYIFTSII